VIDARAFAKAWIAGWNARDLDAIMTHYADDVVFSSPRALEITGSSQVVGKASLRAYWTAALARSPNLRLELETVYAGADSITIAYVRNGETRVCETMEFSRGKVVRGVVARAA
jgi:ketosteroid isomerase-like protein